MESSAGGIEGHSHYRLYDKFTGGLNPALAATTLERPAAGATGAAALIDLYRVPLMFRLYKNGSLINSEYTHFANCFVSEAFNSRANTFYRLNLLPEKGSNEIILAPGEHVVLSASNHVKTYENQFSVKGLDLRPGFEPPASPRRVGGIELGYGNQEPEYLPPFSTNDLPSVVVSGDIPKNAAGDSYQGTKPPPAVRFKEPFLITTFQLKTERDSKFPSRGWIHNSPVNLYASAGLDQKEPWAHQQSELQWEAMTDWPPASPTIEISNTKNRGYGGPGIYAQSGLEVATHSSVPLAPALSLGQLSHAPLNTGGQLPLVSQIVANSFAPPVLDPAVVRSDDGGRTLLDHSFHANSALFDQYFFSSLAEPGGALDRKTSVKDAINGLFEKGTSLANPRFLPRRGALTVAEITDALTAPDGHLKTAAYLLIDSPLNVNSTRVDVWEAVLASNFGGTVPQIRNGGLIAATGDATAFSRHLPGNGAAFEAAPDPLSQDLAKWNGHRRLTKPQIRRLAEEIVVEIQERGPFQSIAEVVNRRPDSGPLGNAGALQAALDRAKINHDALSTAIGAGNGTTADGAPGVLTQADLLTAIAPTLTARGDTFRIRAYGEAGPANGPKVTAWCEAVVQRAPEYLDAGDQPWATPIRPINTRFGRRYEIVSFRWLASSEI